MFCYHSTVFKFQSKYSWNIICVCFDQNDCWNTGSIDRMIYRKIGSWWFKTFNRFVFQFDVDIYVTSKCSMLLPFILERWIIKEPQNRAAAIYVVMVTNRFSSSRSLILLPCIYPTRALDVGCFALCLAPFSLRLWNNLRPELC